MTKISKIAAAIVLLALNAFVYWYAGSREVIPERAVFAEFPDHLGSWRCSNREIIEDEIQKRLQVTDYLSCIFNQEREAMAGPAVHLYVGYHERQVRSDETGESSLIHPPEHCLPGSGWDVIDSRVVPVGEGTSAGEAKRFIIAKGNSRSLVYFWYQSRGRVIARSHEKILYMFLDRARSGRTDGSLVRFTIPIINGDVESAEAIFQEFARNVHPVLSNYVPD